MRRKKLLVAVLLLLGVGAGVFFIGMASRAPLAMGVGGVSNLPSGHLQIFLWATNRTAFCFYGTVYRQRTSGGAWRTNAQDNGVFVGYFFARGDASGRTSSR